MEQKKPGGNPIKNLADKKDKISLKILDGGLFNLYNTITDGLN